MIIETVDLTKIYDGKIGCKDICLSVTEGQVFGFLGPNGAGKSTVVKTLLGLLRPTSGEAWVLGKPVGDRTSRKRVGFLPELFRFQDWLTGQELLEFHAAMYQIDGRQVGKRIISVLDTVNLRGRERDRISTYSKGMQQRLGLASALLPDPELVFLDEPTSALDPLGRREVRDIISKLKARGKTVFLNSHLLSEIEMTCSEVAFIRKGLIVDSGRLQDFTTGNQVLTIRYEGGPEIEEAIKALALDMKTDSGRIQATLASEEVIPLIAAAVVENGGQLYELSTSGYSLEDVFVKIMEDS
ncbi:MAG: ABC transporter ATP-binding protein [Ignavibacteriales bacterium]